MSRTLTERNILVVEDSKLERELLAAAIRTLGYSAITAEDGYVAISLVQADSQHIHLILLDLDMPEIDGISALGHFKTNYPHIPVVIVSGSEDPDELALVEQWGADGFIAKPATRDQLAETIALLTAPDAVVRRVVGEKRQNGTA